MRLRLGIHLDGQRGWQPSDTLGAMVVGPMGLLNVLETQLGLLRARPSQAERIVQYRQCLKRCDTLSRFYHRTFEMDELGTAATLLGWRDLWHLHGWGEEMAAAKEPRLRDLADVEKEALQTVGAGIGERLLAVVTAMDRRKLAVDEVELLDPVAAFPKRWRDILARVPLRFRDAPQGEAIVESTLRDLQRALIRIRAGEKVGDKLRWKEDGSLTVVRAETRFLAGAWLAERMARGEGGGLIVATADGAMLDGILAASDVARQGLLEASAFRPALQVLPLALEIIWEPLNFYGLLQFLTHPVCPVSGYARRKLAGKLADKPGIGGESWERVLDEIDEHYGDRAKDVRKNIQLWVEHPRYAQDSGAPVDKVLARVAYLTDYFRARLADTDRAARIAFNAGFAQCKACGDALQGLLNQGVETLRPRQLQRLVAQATARGSENPLLEAEVGSLMGITNPAAAVEGFDRVLWWQLGMPALPSNYPWSQGEMNELEAAGVVLPSLSDLLERTAGDWLKPILAARRELVLVLPPMGEEVHPVWLTMEALFDKVVVSPLEPILTEADTAHPPVPHTSLPARRRWWQLPEDVAIRKNERASFSSLEIQLFNPYQWLLRYPAALRPSRILSVSTDFRLFGNLAHGLVHSFFQTAAPLTVTDKDFRTWFDAAFDQIVDEEGAVLLMPGRRSDLESLRIKLRASMLQLLSQLKGAGIVRVDSEMDLVGSYVGGELVGSADLVLAKASGEQAIIDMKWSGAKKYPEKLKQNRQLQLAIYGELLRQAGGTWPSVAYYLLDGGQLLATDAHFFPSAQTVRRNTDEGTAELWLRFVETWKWRQAQIDAGRFEVVLDGLAEDEDSAAPEAGLPVETLTPEYNDYLALAGWELGA